MTDDSLGAEAAHHNTAAHLGAKHRADLPIIHNPLFFLAHRSLPLKSIFLLFRSLSSSPSLSAFTNPEAEETRR